MRVVEAESSSYLTISQLKLLLVMFGAPEILPDVLRAVKRHGTEADLVESREIRDSFIVPLLNQYCDMMTYIGVGQKN